MEKYLGPLGILSKATSSASGVGSGEGNVVRPEWGDFSKQCLASHAPSACGLFLCSTEDEEEEEIVHMGNAIMSFYSALIDLLGRCAPEMHVSD